MNEKKYPALLGISKFLGILAIIFIYLIGACVLYLFYLVAIAGGDELAALFFFPLLGILACLISYVILKAFSELIKVFIDIESGIRNIAGEKSGGELS